MAEVILLRGRPGVGKTTVSNSLQARLHVPIIRKDDIYDAVAGYNDSHELRNRMSYDILYNMLETNRLLHGRVILDFPFNRAEDMRRFDERVREQGLSLRPILCVCSDERIWAERFEARKLAPRPNQLITDFEELKRHYGDLSIDPIEGELIVDTVENIGAILERILDYLN